MPLSDTAIRNVKAQTKSFKLFDGGGLFLMVTPAGGRWWRLKYRFAGKEKLLSLGVYPDVGLKEARHRRDAARKMLADGIDPSQHRKASEAAALAKQRELQNTFESIAREWFTSYSPALSPKHACKLLRYLETILFPAFGKKSIASLEPSTFMDAIRPTESKGHITTAHKLMQLCGQVMQYAHITGKISFNPAAGLGRALQPLRHKNLAAITDPVAIGRLLKDINEYQGHPSISGYLRILPYVFTRPSELRLARWEEFNIQESIWWIPAERMKMRRPHFVPLSRQVLSKLVELKQFSGTCGYLFPGVKRKNSTISDAGPLAALRDMGYEKGQMTLHGFRAMASTRLNEMGYRADVIEAQLAHKEPDAVRLAYNRAEYMEERRHLVQAWADYLDTLRAAAG